MASRSRGSRDLEQHRRDEKAPDEPIKTSVRSVADYGTGNSLYVNIPEIAVDIFGIQKQQNLEVETYQDRLVIQFGGDGHGGD